MKKYKYYIIAFVLILIVISSLLYSEPVNVSNEDLNISSEDLNISSEVSEIDLLNEPVIEKIKIDIKGAIKRPGIYELDKDTRVIDAINISGGLLNNADTSTINLSKKLTDEMVIIIYTKEEIEKNKKQEIQTVYIEKECICPKLEENDAEISKLININIASLDELQTLNGVGESKAQQIIEYRENIAPFTKIEDVMNVTGIGKTLFEKFKDQITI